MYIKVTKSAGHSYIQLAESFRDESGKPRQRVLSTLGRVDETGGQVDSILNALLRAKGRTADEPQIEFESALSLGDVWALHRLWQEVGQVQPVARTSIGTTQTRSSSSDQSE